jgi:hypothetical protein
MKTNRRTLAAAVLGAFLMSLLFSAPTARAEVVYTPVNVTISGNGSIKLDLNHDRTKDFVLQSVSQGVYCNFDRQGYAGSTTIKPHAGGGVVAPVMGTGISIDSQQTFSKAKTEIMRFHLCSPDLRRAFGYLGLAFQIDGQTHYGWAQVDILVYYNGHTFATNTTLIDFAYESTPGQAILTGQTSGNLGDARSIPKFVTPDSLDRLADDPAF